MNSVKLKIIAAGLLVLMLFPPMSITRDGYGMLHSADRIPESSYRLVHFYFVWGEYGRNADVQIGHLLVIGGAWALSIWLVSPLFERRIMPAAVNWRRKSQALETPGDADLEPRKRISVGDGVAMAVLAVGVVAIFALVFSNLFKP